ncbi:TPA: DUF551 domain-containing protein [Raoultella planticola]
MIDKYRLDDLRLESGEKGELARWVIQLQTDLDRERRKVGNSPVIPDGYVMVPKEPTQAMCAAFNDSDYGRKSLRERYVAMLAAAQQPQDEPQNIPEIIPGWIPVSERMPDENAEQQVLACFKGGDISTLYYFEGRWGDAYGIVPIRQDVTHWMPLPAAPQEVKGES